MARAETDKLYTDLIEQATDPSLKKELFDLQQGADAILLNSEYCQDNESSPEKQASLLTLIQEMTIPQKIKLALHGNQMARSILIRESNRQIPLFVLENPRLTENEVLEFARNSNLDDTVLRQISANSAWTQSYSVRLALVSNPKTPIAISLKWLKFLQDKDLRILSKRKNVQQIIPTQCRKILQQKEKH